MSNPTTSRLQTSRQQQPSSALSARNHPLYPIVDASSKHSHQACQAIGQLRSEMKLVQTAVQELKELIEKQNRVGFSLKDAGYEVYACSRQLLVSNA